MAANKYNIWQALELAIRLAVRANEEVRLLAMRSVGAGLKGDPGDRGLKGDPGEPGKMPIARAWVDGVSYEGDVRTHAGATWQALRDTGREPSHEDWICLAPAGRDGSDGRSLVVRGTYSPTTEYDHLNVVALNYASWVALRDNPGPCPGEGWQLLAGPGKQGKPGDPGRPGLKGDLGPAGPPVRAMTVDNDGMLTLTNGDGSTVTCDLYPLLDRLGRA